MSEIQAIKVELMEAVKRRVESDQRSPEQLFGIQSTAIGETLADLIYASAQDAAHRSRLLYIINGLIESRWKQLERLKTTDPVP